MGYSHDNLGSEIRERAGVGDALAASVLRPMVARGVKGWRSSACNG